MNLTFSKEEWSLIAHACTQLAFHREEMAEDNPTSEWREANEKEAKAYFAIADKIDAARQGKERLSKVAETLDHKPPPPQH